MGGWGFDAKRRTLFSLLSLLIRSSDKNGDEGVRLEGDGNRIISVTEAGVVKDSG